MPSNELTVLPLPSAPLARRDGATDAWLIQPEASLTVCAVLVTYGRRFDLVRQTLMALLEHHPAIRDIVVVDNGSEYDFGTALASAGLAGRVHVVTLGSNQGSAGGFAAGLHAAAKLPADLIWLLDDDNRPKRDALRRLLDAYGMLGYDPKNLVVSLRPDRYQYVMAAQNGTAEQIVANHFQGMSFGKLVGLALHRGASKSLPASTPKFPCVQLQFAPYGGLLLSRQWTSWVDGPNQDFYVYADDFEYTARIRRNGGRLYLCATSEIEDIDTSWYASAPGARSLVDRGSPDFRVYYSVRNQAVLEKEEQTSAMLYWLNVCTGLFALSVWSLARTKSPAWLALRLKLIVQAIFDGRTHRLGKVDFV